MASSRALNRPTGQDLPGAGATPADVGVAAATVLGLVGWNNVVAAHAWHARHYVVGNLMGTAVVLVVARLRGVSARELGLSSERAAAGARAGAAVAGPIMAMWVFAVMSPRLRWRLRDARVGGMTTRTIVYHAAVRVPLGTVVWEEVAFRAVLPVLLRRIMPARMAGGGNAVVFGLWHVRPTLDAIGMNGFPTTTRRTAAVAAAVFASALVDVLFSRLHRATGSLLAPALVHIASNSGCTVAAFIAGRARHPRRRNRRTDPVIRWIHRPEVARVN